VLQQDSFLAPLPEKKKTSPRGVPHTHPLLCFKFCFTFFYLHHFIKNTKKFSFLYSCFYLLAFSFVRMSNSEVEVRTFKQQGGEEISLTNNVTIFPVGIAEGVYTKVLGRMISIDYLVIECVRKGQITLGMSLLNLLGAVIDVGKCNIRFISPPCNSHIFLRVKSKGKKGRHKAPVDSNASSLDIT
jgi:hypothetical protein